MVFLFFNSSTNSLFLTKNEEIIVNITPLIKNLNPANNHTSGTLFEDIPNSRNPHFTKGNNDPHKTITRIAHKIIIVFLLITLRTTI